MILLWVQISTNHILPHYIMLIMLISHTNTLLKKEWSQIGMNHTSNQFYHYISILRGSSHSHEGGSESPTPNLEVTTLVPNERAP